MIREVFAAVALALTFAIFVPYIRSILAGRTRPHVFSWVTWGLGTAVAGCAQLAGGGGVGAWPILASGIITFWVAWLAYRRRGDASITRLDWVFFLVALSALPAWFLASDPLWAVVVLTTVDLLGFGPTFRSAWTRPHSERVNFYALAALRNLVSLPALERLSATTVLFPAATGAACVVLAALIAVRRRAAARPR